MKGRIDISKFQIGDIIVGNTSEEYGYTDDRAICEVVDFNKSHLVDDIKVRIIYREGYSGDTVFSVESKYFDLVIPAEKSSVKEMTVAEISKELGYEVKIVK